jgi:hypothetical protein
VYLKLDDDIMVSINKRDLYMVYAKAGTRPTSSDYDFKTIIQATDFEEIGFKVFVPGGIMTKVPILIFNGISILFPSWSLTTIFMTFPVILLASEAWMMGDFSKTVT